MVTYTDVVEVMNEVHREKGGTYGEGTAVEIVQLAAEFWQRNKEELVEIGKTELKNLIRSQYSP